MLRSDLKKGLLKERQELLKERSQVGMKLNQVGFGKLPENKQVLRNAYSITLGMINNSVKTIDTTINFIR